VKKGHSKIKKQAHHRIMSLGVKLHDKAKLFQQLEVAVLLPLEPVPLLSLSSPTQSHTSTYTSSNLVVIQWHGNQI